MDFIGREPKNFDYRRLFRRLYSPWIYVPIVGLAVFNERNWALAALCDVGVFFVLWVNIDIFVYLILKVVKLSKTSFVHLIYNILLIFCCIIMQIVFYDSVMENLPESMEFIMNVKSDL